MASVGSVSVDFLAETKNYLQGLKVIENRTDATMAAIKSDIDNASRSSDDLGDANVEAGKKTTNAWKKSTDQLGKFSDEVDSTNDAVKNLADAIVQIGGGLALGSIISEASKAARAYESFSQQMEILLGNADEAKKVIADLNKFSLETPFSPTQVQKAGRSLLSFGIETNKVIPALQKLGDLALGTGSDFNELAILYGKARVANTLFAEDINQLTERGIPVIEAFAKTMGVSTDQVKKLGSEGKISFDTLNEALADTEGPLAKFSGMTEQASKTTDGMISSFEGNMEELKKSLGEFYNDILKPIVAALLEISNGIIAWAKENPVLAETLRDVLAITIALGAAIMGTAGLVAGFKLLSAGMASATAAITAFGGVQASVASMSAARWAAILGPFAAGAMVLTYVMNFVVTEKRITEETINNEQAKAASTELATIQKKNYNEVTNQLKALISATEGYGKSLKDGSGNANGFATAIKSVSDNLPSQLQYLKTIAQYPDSWDRSNQAAKQYLNTLSQMQKSQNAKSPSMPTLTAPKAPEINTDNIKEATYEFGRYFGVVGNVIDQFKNLKSITEDLIDEKGNVELTKFTRNIAQYASVALESMAKLGSEVTKFNEAMGQLGNVNAENTSKQLSLIEMAYQKHYAKRLKAQLADIDKQEANLLKPIQAEIDGYNEQLAIIDNANKEKLKLIKQYEKEKNNIINNSSDKLSEENERRYKEEIARINAEYKQKISIIRKTAADSLQAQVIEQELLQQAEEEKANMLEYYKELNTQQIQDQINIKEEQINLLNEEVATNQAAQESITDQISSALESQSKITEEANEKRRLAEEETNKKLDEVRKQSARVQYANTVAQFNMNKDLQKKMLGVQLAILGAQIAAGIAASFAQGGIIGLIAGAAAGAALLAVTAPTYNAAFKAIQAQTPPLPPPEAFADGGMVGGRLHSQGGTIIEAERGEFVVNRQSTSDNLGILQAINDGRDIGGNTINLAVTNNISGVNDINAIADQIGFSIMQKVKSANYRFA